MEAQEMNLVSKEQEQSTKDGKDVRTSIVIDGFKLGTDHIDVDSEEALEQIKEYIIRQYIPELIMQLAALR